MGRWIWALTAAALLWAYAGRPAAARIGDVIHQGPDHRVIVHAEGLERPWGLAFLPDGATLVTERPGRLRRVEADGRLGPPIAGAPTTQARGQGGLLDVALDPDFIVNRWVYLAYAEAGADGIATAVARGRLEGNRLVATQPLFRQRPAAQGGFHFGARLVFGRDRTLFVGLGDRGDRDRAQDLSTTLGKVIRINRDGSIPADNPFVRRSDVAPEIWSYGHRNIQGAFLHPNTGALWTVEHGAKGGDEINIPLAGRNYGWPLITYGTDYDGAPIGVGAAQAGMEQPIHYWDPSIAPSGMALYSGDLFPHWRGKLLIGSLKFGFVSLLTLDETGARTGEEQFLAQGLRQRVRDVRQGPDGAIWILTDADEGRILRIVP